MNTLRKTQSVSREKLSSKCREYDGPVRTQREGCLDQLSFFLR